MLRAMVDTPNGRERRIIRGPADAERAASELFVTDMIEWPYPPVHSGAVRYRRESMRGHSEDWKDADRLYRDGYGDCEDLAAARAAELVRSGVDEDARPVVYRPRPGLMHVVVGRGDGSIEDPSAALGMGRMGKILFHSRRLRRGAYEAGIAVPVAGDHIGIGAIGASRADAARQALADAITYLGEVGAWGELCECGYVPPGLAEVGADMTITESAAQLETDLAAFRDRWIGRGREAIDSLGITPNVIRAGLDVIGKIGDLSDPNSVLALWDSLTSLAELAGPLGPLLSGFMRAARAVAATLLAAAPAFTIQMNRYRYAYIERWCAENIFGVRSGRSDVSSGMLLRAAGWFPIVMTGGGRFARNSGSVLCNWQPPGGGNPTSLEQNLDLFAAFAGPREINPGPGPVDVSADAQSEWRGSDEGVRSMEIGRALSETLIGSGWQETQSFQDGACKAYRSDGLCFVNNMMYDLQGGTTEHYNVWLNVLLVRTPMLPDALLLRFAEQAYLEGLTKRKTAATTISARDRERIHGAVWGPNDEIGKSWNIARYLRPPSPPLGSALAYGEHSSIPFSATDGGGLEILAEAARRHSEGTTILPPSGTPQDVKPLRFEERKLGAAKPAKPAKKGGIGALLIPLLGLGALALSVAGDEDEEDEGGEGRIRVSPTRRQSGGIRGTGGRGARLAEYDPEAEPPQAARVPDAPPALSPDTADRLATMYEAADAVANKDRTRIRKAVRGNASIARFVRAIARG